MGENKVYIPALKYSWLTSFYDLIMRLTMRELTFKQRLVEQACIEKGQHILDLGCGTATLTILIKKMYPETEVTGLDRDPDVLKIARAKVARNSLNIKLDQGMAFKLPYPDGSFDRVLSSLLLHHLTRENKIRTLREVFRVLRPGGEFHLADFGKPSNVLMYPVSLVMRQVEENRDNVNGLLPEFIRKAGGNSIHENDRYMTVFGTIVLWQAQKLLADSS
jgi:ubiquinone/menaquinone biosynthesis C-methylase UbiE